MFSLSLYVAMCCDLCSKLCDCNKCAKKRNTFIFLKKKFSEDKGISFLSKYFLLRCLLLLFLKLIINLQ